MCVAPSYWRMRSAARSTSCCDVWTLIWVRKDGRAAIFRDGTLNIGVIECDDGRVVFMRMGQQNTYDLYITFPDPYVEQRWIDAFRAAVAYYALTQDIDGFPPQELFPL